MVARHFYRNDDGDMEEIDFVPREGWEVKEGAEEGSSESSTISIPDPDAILDFVPHRRYIVYEDESESDDQVLYSGFVTSDDLGREGGEHLELVADSRVITITVNDMNTLFEQRVMVGSTDRPEETDVERVTWVAESEEMGYFDNLDFLFNANTEDLEARDVAGQSPKQLFDEAAQDADKNYWIGATGNVTDGTDIFLWYGKSSRADYASPLSLSNDPADLIEADLADGSATTWPISENTNRNRTGERIYSGVLVEYEGGRKYRKRDATKAAYTLSGRDLVHPAPEIKSEARAGRRADKLLSRLDEPTITITTTVRLPGAKATMLRAGMTVPIKATHIPEFVDGPLCRILNASIKPVAAGTQYDITIEAEPITAGSASSSCALLVSSVETETDQGEGGDASSVSITPSADGTIIAFLAAGNQNTPGAAEMSLPAGYTNINYESGWEELVDHRTTWRVAYAAASEGVLSTASSTFNGGYDGRDGWIAHQVAVGATLTLVQQKAPGYLDTGSGTIDPDVILDNPVTPGNIITIFCTHSGGLATETITPNLPAETGWTLWADAEQVGSQDNADIHTAIYARCAADTDDDHYGFVGTVLTNYLVVAEWSIS